ncbi:MAG TPA: tetratricopeptide repeat protein [Acidobacteriaceae bacterium]|nr:tetratricopeptide repeat protein [Acidobacteriaceae bacterium]
MTGTNPAKNDHPWSLQGAMVLLAACLMAGIAGGYLIRQWRAPYTAAATRTAIPVAQSAPAAGSAALPSDPAQIKALADASAAPLLAKLQSDPDNADLLTSAGNLYYDAQQYPTAVDFYGRALKTKPSDAAVRTDMGTALWYMGNVDAALLQFDTALRFEPNNPNTLFNRGVVRWQGKQDAAGALADWKKLLATDPNYPGRNQVEQLIAQAQGPKQK